jgi:hypothetical protein
MKKMLFTFIALTFLLSAKAQRTDTVRNSKNEPIFTRAEHEPEFPGGISKFSVFLLKDIDYKANGEKDGYQVSFQFSFIIEKDGSISNVKELKRTPNTNIGRQLIKRISKSRGWKPAMQNNLAVRYLYHLPLSINLSEQQK